MSPEQALGHAVDKRTDIWAFGCIVFEMLTGRAPFDGETILEIRAAILGRDPDWSLLPPSTPPAVAGLIRRCLDKHLKSRLRDIGDAFEALDHVPSSAAPQRVSVAGGTWDRRLMAAVTASAAVVLILTASSIVGRRDAPVPPVFSRVVRLTTGPALDFGPAISPDGSWIAYLSNARGPVDIYVKFPASGAAANLTADSGLELPARSEVGGLAVSPDGASIAFDAGARPGTPSNLFDGWVIPAPLGGIPRKLVERGRSIRWSPDGTLIAYVRAGAAAGDALYVADADGTNERELVPTRGGMHLHWPAWSADGRYVYFSYGPATANGEPTEIHRVSITGGGREPIVRTVRRALYAAPTPDGTALVYAANPFTTELGLWWRWLSPGAVARPLTTGVGEYAEVAMARRGSQLVASIVESRETLISIDVTAAKAPEATLADGSTGDQDPTLSPVGDELVFSSSRNGNRSLSGSRREGCQPAPAHVGTTLDERPSVPRLTDAASRSFPTAAASVVSG